MKEIVNTKYTVARGKSAACARVFILRGDALTIDAHPILHSLCTPFFPRR